MDHERKVSGESRQGVTPSHGPASPSAPGWSVPKERPSVPPAPAATPHVSRQMRRETLTRSSAKTSRAASDGARSKADTAGADRAVTSKRKTERCEGSNQSPRTPMGPGASLFSPVSRDPRRQALMQQAGFEHSKVEAIRAQ
jgi:hypothetical protein